MIRKGLDKHNGIYQNRPNHPDPSRGWFFRFVTFSLGCLLLDRVRFGSIEFVNYRWFKHPLCKDQPRFSHMVNKSLAYSWAFKQSANVQAAPFHAQPEGFT